MILMSFITLFISFLLQGLVSNFQNYTLTSLSIFSTVFLLINFVVLQPYFVSDKRFLFFVVGFGLLFDIVYSNTFVLCTFLFLLVFFVNKVFNFFFPSNVITVNFVSLISIIIYHVISFLILKVLNFDSFNIFVLIRVLLSNFIMTILYTTILYYIVDFIYRKFNLKIVRD